MKFFLFFIIGFTLSQDLHHISTFTGNTIQVEIKTDDVDERVERKVELDAAFFQSQGESLFPTHHSQHSLSERISKNEGISIISFQSRTF
jgi:hypothetical protein